jgi:signal transduction histidine kinase
MRLRRVRVQLAVLIAAVAFLMALVPLLSWRSSRHAAIREDLDQDLVWQMEEVQAQFVTGQPATEFAAWLVNTDEGWVDPYDETDLEPPLFTWVRETGEYPGFREYSLDGEVRFRAYIRRIDPGQAFVTLTNTGERDVRLDELGRRTWLMAFTAAILAAGAGWILAGVALRPARRLLADRQGFLADAAHEMRTPLAVILASSSQALARPRAEEEYVRSLAEIRSAAERAATGVNELLDLVRFDSGQAIPRLAPLRLDLLAEEIAASSRVDDTEVIAEPSEPVVVNADMALVRQAIDNLVRNATRRATRVELVSHVDGREGVIDVLDNGPGFDPAVLDKAFDRYQRGDRRGDVGIGLAIVKAIAHAHGGDVTVANRNGGSTGARVSLRLPLHAASA